MSATLSSLKKETQQSNNSNASNRSKGSRSGRQSNISNRDAIPGAQPTQGEKCAPDTAADPVIMETPRGSGLKKERSQHYTPYLRALKDQEEEAVPESYQKLKAFTDAACSYAQRVCERRLTELQILESKKVAEITAIRERYTTEISKQKDKLTAVHKEELRTVHSDYREEIRTLQSKNKAELASLKDKHGKQVNEQNIKIANLDTTKTVIEKQKSEQIEYLKQTIDEKTRSVAALELKNKNLIQQLKNIEEERNDLDAKYDNLVGSLRATQSLLGSWGPTAGGSEKKKRPLRH